jgi:pilus assembly protein CpaE
MSEVTLRLAVVSADPKFRSAVAEVLRAHPEMATVIIDLPIYAAALTADTIERVHAESPEAILVDLDSDPAGGMRMLRLLGDAVGVRTIIATGPALAPELLLEGMKSGITEYLPAPVDAHDLADSLRRAARRLGRGASYAPAAVGRILTFVGAKGGTGVTTGAANVALQLHRDNPRRTLLLDLNLEGGSMAVAMGLKPRYSIVDLLENFHRIDESLLASLVIPHASGVEVLAAPLLPESMPAVSGEQMRATLRLLRRHYDVIAVDLGRPYSEYGRAVIDNSDLVFLMLVPDVLAIHGAKRLLPLIRKGIESRDGRVEIVLNRTSPEDEVQKADVDDALGVGNVHVLRRDDAIVLSSLNRGKPVALNGGRSRFAKDVKALCALIDGAPRPKAEKTSMGELLGFGRRSVPSTAARSMQPGAGK